MSNLMIDGMMFEKIEPAKSGNTILATPEDFEKIVDAMNQSHLINSVSVYDPQSKFGDYISPNPSESRGPLGPVRRDALPAGEHIGKFSFPKDSMIRFLDLESPYPVEKKQDEKSVDLGFFYAPYLPLANPVASAWDGQPVIEKKEINFAHEYLLDVNYPIKSLYYVKSIVTPKADSDYLLDKAATESQPDQKTKYEKQAALLNAANRGFVSKRRVMEEFGLGTDDTFAELNKLEPSNTMYFNDMGLDRLFGGVKKGELVVIAGQSGAGRGALALKASIDLAKQHRRVVFINCEMSPQDIVDRATAYGIYEEATLSVASPNRDNASLMLSMEAAVAKGAEAIVIDHLDVFNIRTETKATWLDKRNFYQQLINFGRMNNVAVIATKATTKIAQGNSSDYNLLPPSLMHMASKVAVIEKNFLDYGQGVIKIVKNRNRDASHTTAWFDYDTGRVSASLTQLEY